MVRRVDSTEDRTLPCEKVTCLCNCSLAGCGYLLGFRAWLDGWIGQVACDAGIHDGILSGGWGGCLLLV